MTTFYFNWKKELYDQIQTLYDENIANDKNIYNIILSYIKNNYNNRYIDIEPLIYFYNKYYSDYTETCSIKICDQNFEYVIFENIKNIKLRDEIRFKMILYTMYLSVKKIIKDLFNVDIQCHFEKYSSIYKENKDKFISTLESKSGIKIIYNNKYRVHDCLLIIEHNEKKYEIACEFNEKTHTNEYDENRSKSLKIPLVSLFVRHQGETQEDISNYIKKIIMDIIYKSCALIKNKSYIAKLLVCEEMDEDNYHTLSLLIDCCNVDIFKFDDLLILYRFDINNQIELKDFLIENNILNDDDTNDPQKATYFINEEDEYYFDNNEFKKLTICMNSNLSINYKLILNIFMDSQAALLKAAEMLLIKDEQNRIDAPHISGYMNEITMKPIEETIEYYNTIIDGMSAYKAYLNGIRKYNHTSNKPLPYIKYKKNAKLLEKDLQMIKDILGNNYTRLLKNTIIYLNNNSVNKIILYEDSDELLNNIKIKNAIIDYQKLHEYHFCS
jgi:hypothetical protein